MSPEPTSPVRTWHTDTYPAINPSLRPSLHTNIRGKKVIVSGAGTGIGRAISLAFAEAGAAELFLLGRREGLLDETKQLVQQQYGDRVAVTVLAVDVTDLAAVKAAAEKIGTWDVLLSNAGVLVQGKVAEVDAEEWWKGFEINVRGPFNLLHALLPTRSTSSTPVVISTSAGAVQMPSPAVQAAFSSYNASKLGALRLIETAAAEYPDVHFVSMHPGIVATDMLVRAEYAMDTVELPAHFTVWLCSEEARWLGGRLVWCNWDVEELVGLKDVVVGSGADVEGTVVDREMFRTVVGGFPFEYRGFGMGGK